MKPQRVSLGRLSHPLTERQQKFFNGNVTATFDLLAGVFDKSNVMISPTNYYNCVEIVVLHSGVLEESVKQRIENVAGELCEISLVARGFTVKVFKPHVFRAVSRRRDIVRDVLLLLGCALLLTVLQYVLAHVVPHKHAPFTCHLFGVACHDV